MKHYKTTGDAIINEMGNIKDSNGNLIVSWSNYIITEIDSDKGNKIIIETEENYQDNRNKLKAMIYTISGFNVLIKTLDQAGIDLMIDKEIVVNEIIKTFTNLEDYESAEKLKSEWEQYKNEINGK